MHRPTPKQRAVLLRSMIKIAGEHGAQAATVEHGDLINPLMSCIVFPYLGGGPARAELNHRASRGSAPRRLQPQAGPA